MFARIVYAFFYFLLLGTAAFAAADSIAATSEETIIGVEPADTSMIAADSLAGSSAEPEVMPELISFVNAAYPAEKIKKGIAGTVMLELLVNDSGSVDSVVITQGIDSVLDSCAAVAARLFRFTPAQAQGVPVAVYLQYAYTFSLDDAVDSVPLQINYSGICLEKGTRQPLSNATIAVSYLDTTADTTLVLPFSLYLKKIGADSTQQYEEGSLVTTSSDSGTFSFSSLPSGKITVKILVPGYETFVTHELIAPNEETTVLYYIQRTTYSDYEVIVYGKAEEKEVSRRQMSVNEVRKIPGFGGDAIKAIQAFPGVARKSAGSGDVIVRGAPTWDSRFYLDGMEIPLLYHFGDLKSTYNSEGLSSLDFYPGGFGTRYGGAVGGIVEIKGRKGTSERIKGSAEISTLDGSVFVEGPITDSITFIANGRRSFIGDVVQQIFKMAPETFPFTLYPYYWDYLFRTDVATKKRGKFYVSLFGSLDSLSFIYPEMRFGSDEISEKTDQMGMKTSFHTGVVGWDYKLSSTMRNSLKYNLMKIVANFSSPFSQTRQDIIVNHVRNQFEYTILKNATLAIGADMQWSNADLDLTFPDAFNSILNFKQPDWHFSDLAGYINFEWKPTDRLQLVPGIRYDYYEELSYDGSIVPEFWNYSFFNNDRGFSGEPSFRLNGRYQVKKDHTFKWALGTYNQTPEPMGEVILPGWGDPHMPATKGAQYVSGYEWQITDIVDLDAQVYLNRQWDIPVVTRDGDIAPGASIYNHSGLGRMYGLELMLRHNQDNRFFGWVTYSLSRSERYNRFTKDWIIYGEDETHYLQVVGSWKLPRNYEAGFHVKFASGKPTTSVRGIKEEDENGIGSGSIIPLRGATNADRMAPAFQVDLRFDKKLIYNKYIASFFFDLQNIGWFLYKSPDSYLYSDFYDEKQAFSMFPLMAIGVRCEF